MAVIIPARALVARAWNPLRGKDSVNARGGEA
jgi:hypothetical protein